MSLPINLPKHGLSKDEAAEYCSVSVKTLDGHGPAPTKIGAARVPCGLRWNTILGSRLRVAREQ